MGSRAILTAVAATAAALGSGTASAGAAAATTAPTARTAPTASADPAGSLTTPLIMPLTGVVGAENAVDVGNGWCVAPLHLSGPLTQVVSADGRTCGGTTPSGAPGGRTGVHVLDGLCVAPIAADGPDGAAAAPSSTCDDENRPGSFDPGGVSVLRGFSIVGVPATY